MPLSSGLIYLPLSWIVQPYPYERVNAWSPDSCPGCQNLVSQKWK